MESRGLPARKAASYRTFPEIICKEQTRGSVSGLCSTIARMPDPTDNPDVSAAPGVQPQLRFSARARKIAEEWLLECLRTILAVALIALTEFVVKQFFGQDAKFFDRMPVHWVFDASDIAVVVRLVIRSF